MTNKDYNEFYLLYSHFHHIAGDYFDKHIQKGNNDIEFTDVWFSDNEIVFSYYNLETELGWTHTISIEKFIDFCNNEYIK